MEFATPRAVDRKIIVLGNGNVGKTCIIQRYCNGIFQIETLHTIGAGFFTHTAVVDTCDVTLFLWDTAGTERFRAIAPSLLRGAHGVVLVYDVTEPVSFSDLHIWLEMFLDTVQVDLSCELPVLVLGNKCDLEAVVGKETVKVWCEKNRILHSYCVSAKTGEKVDEAMNALVRTLICPVRLEEAESPVQLAAVPAPKKKDCC
jgi:small GTP-binding protein